MFGYSFGDAETLVVQIAVTGIALLIAWRGFTAAGRARSPDAMSRPVVGALITTATVVGAFLTGWPSIIAVVLNYVKRSEARGTWLE